jgi:putative transposase
VQWAGTWGIKLDYIQLGWTQQSAYAERFNRTVRYELLFQYHWDDPDHVERVATQWMWA